MSATYEKLSSNKAKLSFVISAEEFDAAVSAAYKKKQRCEEEPYVEGSFFQDSPHVGFKQISHSLFPPINLK